VELSHGGALGTRRKGYWSYEHRDHVAPFRRLSVCLEGVLSSWHTTWSLSWVQDTHMEEEHWSLGYCIGECATLSRRVINMWRFSLESTPLGRWSPTTVQHMYTLERSVLHVNIL
jgi:hypothetical protein